jgi:osmoprotectant transport system substrate-binding protein
MKKSLLSVVLILIFAPAVHACVGKTLTIGVVRSADGQVLAELLSTLINERTGTTVKIQLFDSGQELVEALKEKQVDISFGNTTRALHTLNRPVETDLGKALNVVREAYEKEWGLIWLKPFSFLNGNSSEGPSYTATVLRVDVFNNFPALPRVIGKLGMAITDTTYSKLVKSVESGEQPKRVAKDFLKSRKLI